MVEELKVVLILNCAIVILDRNTARGVTDLNR